jgi:hypothetical protein
LASAAGRDELAERGVEAGLELGLRGMDEARLGDSAPVGETPGRLDRKIVCIKSIKTFWVVVKGLVRPNQITQAGREPHFSTTADNPISPGLRTR